MVLHVIQQNQWADPEGGGGRGFSPPGKSQVGFLRNTGTDTPLKSIGPLESNSFSMEVCTAL